MYSTIVSLISSLNTSSMSSLRVFLLQRSGYYSDIKAPTKMLLIVFPLIILVTVGMGILWAMALAAGPISLVFFGIYLFLSYYLLMKCNMHVNKQSLGQMGIHPIVVAWMSPFSPQNLGKKFDLLKSVCKLLACLGVPVFIVWLMTYQVFQKAASEDLSLPVEQTTFYFYLMGDCIVVFVVSMVLYFLGDYRKLMKVTNVVCCKKPVVHRSVIFDYLACPEKYSDGRKSCLCKGGVAASWS